MGKISKPNHIKTSQSVIHVLYFWDVHFSSQIIHPGEEDIGCYNPAFRVYADPAPTYIPVIACTNWALLPVPATGCCCFAVWWRNNNITHCRYLFVFAETLIFEVPICCEKISLFDFHVINPTWNTIGCSYPSSTRISLSYKANYKAAGDVVMEGSTWWVNSDRALITRETSSTILGMSLTLSLVHRSPNCVKSP